MDENLANIDELSRINEQILRQPTTPAKESKPSGTLATLLHNIDLYNLTKSEKVETEFRAAIPALVKMGLFSLFPPEEWMQGNNPGRKFVGQAALEYLQNQ